VSDQYSPTGENSSDIDSCGLHHTYIGGIERGERNLGVDNIERVAKALGVKPGELLS
jgi:transcriptional regulator with XRE-family HTH domain